MLSHYRMEAAVRTISHYSSDMDILLVGEGDFSFAAALARAFQHAPRLFATSLDSREMLHINYGRFIIEPRLGELLLKGVVVLNDVDVTTMMQHPTLSHVSFDRIIYNFPHSGFIFGLTEWAQDLIKEHRKFMRKFFENARRMLKEGGEVHVTHHMCEPYSRWRLQEEAAKSGLKLGAWHKFEAKVFLGYTPRRGAGVNVNDTFPLRNPVTFIFFLPYSPPPPCIIPPPCLWWEHGPCMISTPPCTIPPFAWQPCPSTTIPYPPFSTPSPPPQSPLPSNIINTPLSLPPPQSPLPSNIINTHPSLPPPPPHPFAIINTHPSLPPPQSPLPSNIINTHPSLPPPPPHPFAINPPCPPISIPLSSSIIVSPPCSPISIPLSPSIIVSPPPPPPKKKNKKKKKNYPPNIISTHQFINSHQNNYKLSPSTFNMSSDLECNEHSNSNHHIISESFSFISTHLDHLLLYDPYVQ